MRHLTPYGQGRQRFREVDPQEMHSLMSEDAPGELTQSKVKAVLDALDRAFPKGYLVVQEYRTTAPRLEVRMLAADMLSGLCREHGRVVRLVPSADRPGEAKYEERNKWVLRWSNWAHPQSNNLHVHVHLGMKGRVEHDLAVIASADDYFYSRLRTHHGEGPLAGRTDPRHFVCEGMRGLLDLVGSIGRGDI